MAMRKEAKQLYEFGPFRLDATERLLLREGKVVALPPKVIETLLVLVEHNGHILEKEELMRRLWPDTFVEESSLSQNVFQLRKALGDGGSQQRYIETIPKRGYRFVAPVREVRYDGESEIVGAQRTETRIIIEAEETNGEGESFDHQALNSNGTFAPGQEAHNQSMSRAAQAASLPASARFAVSRVKTKRKTALLALASIAVLIGLAFALSALVQRQWSSQPSTPFQNMRLTKLTSTGKARVPALSPDGKYVAHVVEEAGRQSLWIRQVATTSNVQVVPPAEVEYQGLTFSRDGNFIYYVNYPRPKHIATLYAVPVLGGTPKKLIEDVDSPVTFSPDGARLAFERNYPARGETALIIVNADGTGEQRLATRKRPLYFSFAGPAWSPDGKVIACGAGGLDADGSYTNVVAVNVADGREAPITPQKWTWVGQVAWFGDGSGVVAVAWHQASPIFADQIWHLPYPHGEARRITNDLNGYRGVSIAADSSTLVSAQSTRISRIWVAPQADAERARAITSGLGDNYSQMFGMDWMADGRLIYASHAGGNPDIWVMNPDGSQAKQLTVDARTDLSPAVSPDGRHIAFVSNRAGRFNVWLMDGDGNNPKQLTSGLGERCPSFSADGQWVVYGSSDAGKSGIWKVSIDGGAPVQLAARHALGPAASPDGKLIGHYTIDEQTSKMKLAVMPFAGGPPIKIFEIPFPDPPLIRWTADGRLLTYIDTRGGVSNIWGQAIEGGPPKQLTHFTSEHIYRFAWSQDGQQLACERGTTIYDLVLITNFK